MTEQLHFHFSLSCIGEGNGNPLQCSCLENPRDRGAWWAAVSGVAQSQIRLKQLSSSSSIVHGASKSPTGLSDFHFLSLSLSCSRVIYKWNSLEVQWLGLCTPPAKDTGPWSGN